MTISRNASSLVIFIALAVSLFLAAALSGCREEQKALSFATEYQAVFMDNGQTFFGRLENAGSPYPVLTDVFFIVRQQDAQTKEIKNILVKRGSEWHAPDRMYINASHIAIIEPVSPGSQVAKLISEAKANKPASGQ